MEEEIFTEILKGHTAPEICNIFLADKNAYHYIILKKKTYLIITDNNLK